MATKYNPKSHFFVNHLALQDANTTDEATDAF